jgi:nucleoside-diphosphate-sugar epimerase
VSVDRILVTGATGKVGRHFLERFLKESRFAGAAIRALSHNRVIPPNGRLEVVRGTIADRDVVRRAMAGVSHVLHLATCKETPAEIIDVTTKGLFWLLEEARTSPGFRQFLVIGDASLADSFHVPQAAGAAARPPAAGAGCYALSKVLEEAMLEHYCVQHNLNGCCLRAPWIVEQDDLKFHLGFGAPVFGEPRWRDLVGEARAAEYAAAGTVPVMLDPDGAPVARNLLHVEDLVSALLLAIDHPKARHQTFNICMDEPVDYRKLATHLQRTRGLPSVDVKTPFRATALNNTKTRLLLGWRPHYDLARLADEAFAYQRAADDPRKVPSPG